MSVDASRSDTTGSDFYEKRYSAEWQALQDQIFAEAADDYFGQSSLTSTADYDRVGRWLAVGPGAKALDVACGGGAPALRLARSTGCHVTGIDISEEAIAKAERSAASSGIAERVRFLRHDASMPLPFAPGSFDAILCIDALVHIAGRDRVMAGWHELLRPGGRLVVTDSVLTGPVANDEIAERTVSGRYFLVPNGYDERLLRQAGFELSHFEDITEQLAANAERHCAARKRHAEALRRLEGDRMFETLNRYRTAIARLARERRLSHHLIVASKPAAQRTD